MLSNFFVRKFDSGWAGAARAVRLAMPQHCALCAASCGNALLCADCMAQLPRLGSSCPRCALPSPHGQLCGACLVRPPPYTAAVCALAYAFPVDRLVGRLKYGRATALAEPLGLALAAAIGATGARLPDAIVPLPLSIPRQRRRGFNQAAEITRAVASGLHIPVEHALARDRDAPPQAGLARAARRRNVRGAFRVVRPVRGATVAIVDDVMTTGATLAAAAQALLRAGAREAHAWAVARTLPPGP